MLNPQGSLTHNRSTPSTFQSQGRMLLPHSQEPLPCKPAGQNVKMKRFPKSLTKPLTKPYTLNPKTLKH